MARSVVDSVVEPLASAARPTQASSWDMYVRARPAPAAAATDPRATRWIRVLTSAMRRGAQRHTDVGGLSGDTPRVSTRRRCIDTAQGVRAKTGGS